MQIHRFAEVSSTMDECRSLATAGAPDGTLVLADAQTAGRGRHGHGWYSPPGSALYLSLLLRPKLAARQLGWLTMAGALAVIDAVRGVGPLAPGLRWFNDVQLNGRKLAGVLTEASYVLGDHVAEYCVLGIGVNVNTDFAAAPADVRARAISLREVMGVLVDRDALLASLLASLAARVAALERGESPLAEYSARLETVGTRVRAGAVDGLAVRVNDDGALVVRGDDGVEHRVGHGDVSAAAAAHTHGG